MNYYNNKKSRGGFTLIELLVVIAVIGVLSGIVLQSLQGARYKSQNATRLSDIDQIDKAIQIYLTKTNASLPSTGVNVWQCVGLTSGTCWGGLFSPATTLNAALAGNIAKIPKDPFISAGVGDYYLYNSIYAGTHGTGSYLNWYSYNIGSKPCGRGYTFGGPTGEYQQCLLFVGKN